MAVPAQHAGLAAWDSISILVTYSLTMRWAAGAVNVSLTPDEIKYLEEPYRPLAIDGHA